MKILRLYKTNPQRVFPLAMRKLSLWYLLVPLLWLMYLAETMTEDEMAGWHHWLDGRESEWTRGVGNGQGGLACCDSWGRKESDRTEWPNWTDDFVKKHVGELSSNLLSLPCCVCMNCGILVILSYLSNDHIGKVITINSKDDRHLPIVLFSSKWLWGDWVQSANISHSACVIPYLGSEGFSWMVLCSNCVKGLFSIVTEFCQY